MIVKLRWFSTHYHDPFPLSCCNKLTPIAQLYCLWLFKYAWVNIKSTEKTNISLGIRICIDCLNIQDTEAMLLQPGDEMKWNEKPIVPWRAKASSFEGQLNVYACDELFRMHGCSISVYAWHSSLIHCLSLLHINRCRVVLMVSRPGVAGVS